jgi:hypothetical protein
VLEHLSYEDAIRALRSSLALLRPGGTFRLVVPDLHARAARYLAAAASGEPQAADSFLDGAGLGSRQRLRGARGLVRSLLGNSQHLWMWDERSMRSVLEAVGFVNIRRCRLGDNQDPMFAAVEQESRFFDGQSPELAMECQRPGDSRDSRPPQADQVSASAALEAVG